MARITIKDELRDLIQTLGKKPEGITLKQLLDELEDVFQGAADDGGIVVNIDLPSVTSADNGKVLGVVNGHWAVMPLSSFIQDSTGT